MDVYTIISHILFLLSSIIHSHMYNTIHIYIFLRHNCYPISFIFFHTCCLCVYRYIAAFLTIVFSDINSYKFKYVLYITLYKKCNLILQANYKVDILFQILFYYKIFVNP